MYSLINTLVAISTTTAISLLEAEHEHEHLPFENSTFDGTTTPSSAINKKLYGKKHRMLIAGFVMILGVVGNSWALLILARKLATKNSKYTLMLRCLATNNLIGLFGMIFSLLMKLFAPEILQRYKIYDCGSIVVWRFFGLSSGCIAAVMAIERWMALARPFIYHKHITYELIRKSIKLLVLFAVVITFLPIFGFGSYYTIDDTGKMECQRYRDADGFSNKLYSVLFMMFGSLLCLVIVACNLFVTRVLCNIGRTRVKRHMHTYDLVNREKGGSSRIDADSNSSGSTLFTQHPQNTRPSYHHSTSVTMTADASPEEIKFAKLMAFLSISFVICWMPQMIAIPLAIMPNRVPKDNAFFLFADVLMAVHFTSDPYIYVLSRSGMFSCFKRWNGGIKRSQSIQSRRTIAVEQTTDCNFN